MEKIKKILKKILSYLSVREFRVRRIRKKFTRILKPADLRYIGNEGVNKWIEYAEKRVRSLEKLQRFKKTKVMAINKKNKKLIEIEYLKEAIQICKSL